MFRRVLTMAIWLLVASCATTTATPGADECRTVDVNVSGERLGLGNAALVVKAHDNYFDPGCSIVPIDSELTLVVTNEGRYPHDLTMGNGQSVRVDSGQTAFVDLSTGAEPIPFTCTIHPGMDGLIEVGPK